MKKILFVVESLAGGGAEKVLITLIKYLDKSKYDVTILTVVNTGIYLKEVSQYCKVKYMLPDYAQIKGNVAKIKYKLDYKWIYSQPTEKVYQKYISEKYDVEVAFVEGFATKLVAASSNGESSKICWLHIDMQKNPYADNYYSSIDEERETYMKYNHIVGVSESVKRAFEKKFSLPNSVEVIYNPIDINEIEAKAAKGTIEKPNRLCIISIGRLEKQKGYDRLINALAALEKQKFDYTLWILGEGSEKSVLEQQIAEAKLCDKIFLLGFKENPYCWLNAADVFVCSSRAEGYSLVIAEAMILGKPVLSVDCAGPNELLNFGEYGKLVPNTDTDLYRMIYELLNDEIDLNKYADLAVQRREFFELSKVIEKVEMLF